MLFGAQRSVVLWLLLVLALGLTYWETREQRFSARTSAWWLLLVTLTHVLGYIGLRAFLAMRSADPSVPSVSE